MVERFLSTEKSFNAKDKGVWTFVVGHAMSKPEIKKAVEELFGVSVQSINITVRGKKIRRVGGSRFITRRHKSKIARIHLKKDSKKMDLNKLNK